jgi:hypothetical protein
MTIAIHAQPATTWLMILIINVIQLFLSTLQIQECLVLLRTGAMHLVRCITSE